MSQSVNVLSCICPNCPNYPRCKQMQTVCIRCETKDCIDCHLLTDEIQKTSTAQKMVRKNNLLSCHLDWLNLCPELHQKLEVQYKELKRLQAQGRSECFENNVDCNCVTPQNECIKIKIRWSVSLSDNGESLHLKMQPYYESPDSDEESCEFPDSDRQFRVTVNNELSEIDIPVKPSKIIINIYEDYHQGAVMERETGL